MQERSDPTFPSASTTAPSLPQAGSLYPRNQTPGLDPAIFRSPPAVYRGTPFWSWNNRLDLPQLLRQIDQFKEMGFGGFHAHSRTGLATEYLGPEFLAAVKACTEHAAKQDMLCWLYDEDRWPSGFAGGLVTADPKHRAKHLLFTPTPYQGQVTEACQDERAAGTRSENGTLLARYEVTLKDGRLARYRRLTESESPSGGTVWYAYLETAQPSSWFNHQTYVDTFSAAATRRFIETTHERYAVTVGEYFGGVIPAIFTDEPQFPKKTQLLNATDLKDVIQPFTADFVETYRKLYQQDLLDHLPEIYWDLPGRRPSLARYRYHEHTAERFAAGFGDVLGEWCEQHKIALTGHMLGEANLFQQTRGIGESMRPLRSFQIPGIDMLCDRIELTTAKQAQSVAHQYGRPGVLSELYGVTNWDFDFAGHKRQGDWQAAFGVTVRVPHLAWVSMAGESKRDYPAAIGYQSPWYKEYPLVEDHFARLNTVLTRGRPLIRVGVIHPVESYWLNFGPVDLNQREMEERETAFADVTSWLSFGLMDFNFISEGLLPTQTAQQTSAQFAVGTMRYDAVLVPHLRTLRADTLKQLQDFADQGGKIIFAGKVPSLVSAVPSGAPAELAARCTRIPLTRRHILEALAPLGEIDISHADGTPADSILHQFRIDGSARHLFLCNTDRDRSRLASRIRLRGRWDLTELDTHAGTTRPLYSSVTGDRTVFAHDFAAHGHLLLTLMPRTRDTPPPSAQNFIETGRLTDPVAITLSEPNVLLLDQAAWRLDDGPWQPPEEILRLDNLARTQLKLPMRAGRIAQPWTDTAPAPVVAQLQLRFTIQSDVPVAHPSLALENPEQTYLHFNGQPVDSKITGWWVDESIKTVALPSFPAGTHKLALTLPFTRKTDVEWCYLLGDFGVAVAGSHARITAPVRELAFGDWVPQGMPFYAGNVTYHCTIQGAGKETILETPKFKNPLLTIDLDGKPAGKIAFAPYQVNLGKLSGSHKLDITAYGNRINAFGPVHNPWEKLSWVGPGAWRGTGQQWSYEYQLKRMGLLVTPILKTPA